MLLPNQKQLLRASGAMRGVLEEYFRRHNDAHERASNIAASLASGTRGVEDVFDMLRPGAHHPFLEDLVTRAVAARQCWWAWLAGTASTRNQAETRLIREGGMSADKAATYVDAFFPRQAKCA